MIHQGAAPISDFAFYRITFGDLLCLSCRYYQMSDGMKLIYKAKRSTLRVYTLVNDFLASESQVFGTVCLRRLSSLQVLVLLRRLFET